MIIKPSAAIRNNYRKVADYCIETRQPIFLTNNGEPLSAFFCGEGLLRYTNSFASSELSCPIKLPRNALNPSEAVKYAFISGVALSFL